MHRIAWLDANIRGERYPDSRKLAEKFEISIRQAQRDIEYLKYTMGAPLEYLPSKKGYFYSNKTFLLPANIISEEEKQLLTYVANQYKMTGGTDAKRLAELFSRLGGGSCNNTNTNPGINQTYTLAVLKAAPDEKEAFNKLSEALGSKRKLSMVYINNKGETTKRIFHTYKLFSRDQNVFATGYCELRCEIRVFRISRIKKIELLEETYIIPAFFNDNSLEQGTGFRYKTPYTALVEFEQIPEPEALKHRMDWDSGSICKIYFDSSDEFINALLTQKSSFRIIFPEWLKHKLKQRLEKIFLTNFSNDNI